METRIAVLPMLPLHGYPRSIVHKFPMPSPITLVEDKLNTYFTSGGHKRRCKFPTHLLFCNLIISSKILFMFSTGTSVGNMREKERVKPLF